MSAKSLFKKTELSQIVNDVCLALSAHKDGDYRPSGTAVIISKSLAITAKHVIQDFLRYYDNVQVRGSGDSLKGTFNLMAFNIQDNGSKGILFDVTQIWISPITDVAILKLSVSKSSDVIKLPPVVTLDFRIPTLGDRIVGFGYPRPSLIKTKDEIVWTTDPSTTTGEVTDVFQHERDSSRINFPCFQTNARFDAAMSGGPVFNSLGHVCGLICSNLPPDDNYVEHVSYVTALWPIANIEIEVNLYDKNQKSTIKFIELIDKGFVNAVGLERIVLDTNTKGKTVKFGYKY